MQDQDDRRREGWRGWRERSEGRGWRGEDDNARDAQGDVERRSWDPPYGDERTYGRQGQRGGNYGGSYEAGEGPGRYPRGGGSYGQQDYSRSAQRSPSREGYRYGDTGQAGQGGFDATREHGAGGYGGYSGYGSSGQGQYGPGGFARGGYGASGYGGDYGQGVYGGGEYDRRRGGREGVYGEGAGRSEAGVRGYEPYGGGDRAETYDAEFDPDYLQWRRTQLASYDRDYQHWREHQARTHDEDYRRWREERRRKFHEDFHGWRQTRSGGGQENPREATAPSASGALATDPAIQNIADGGEGRADLHKDHDSNEDGEAGRNKD